MQVGRSKGLACLGSCLRVLEEELVPGRPACPEAQRARSLLWRRPLAAPAACVRLFFHGMRSAVQDRRVRGCSGHWKRPVALLGCTDIHWWRLDRRMCWHAGSICLPAQAAQLPLRSVAGSSCGAAAREKAPKSAHLCSGKQLCRRSRLAVASGACASASLFSTCVQW